MLADSWVEAYGVTIEGMTKEKSHAALDDFARTGFTKGCFIKPIRCVVLCIGADAGPIEVDIFRKSKLCGAKFECKFLELEEAVCDNEVGLSFQSNELAEAVRETRRTLRCAGVKNEGASYQDSPDWNPEFSEAYFGIVQFTNPQDAHEESKSVRNPWVGKTFYLDDFHLCARSETFEIVVVE